MRRTLLVFLLLLGVWQAIAQNRQISGKVTDQKTGESLPGVSVYVKGSTVGTVTDLNGMYAISASEGNTLVFQSVGLLSQEVLIGAQTTINIQMQADITELGEIVVTAAAIEREKNALGYSIGQISNERLERKSEPDVFRSMQGKIAGVNIVGSNGAPGSSTNINIRGNTSFNNTNRPLIIVDGIPFSNDFSTTENTLVAGSAYSNRGLDLDPNNIESVTVLKSAAAASLYGSRAANGALIITTKSGKSKRSKKGTEISFASSYSIEEIVKLPDYQNTYGQGGDFAYIGGAFGNYGPRFGGPYHPNSAVRVSDGTVPHHFSGAEWANIFPQFQGARVPYQAYPDNVSDFFKTGSILENSISVNGGTEKSSITASFSRMQQDGIMPNSKFDRTSVNIGGSAQLDNKFTIGGALSYVRSEQRALQQGAANAVGNASVVAHLWYLPRSYDLTGYPRRNPINGQSAYYLPASFDNPYWSSEENIWTSQVDRYFGNLNISYDVFDWLSISYRIGMNAFTDRRRQAIGAGSVASLGTQGGGVIDDFVSFQEIESNFLVSFDKKIGEDFSIKANLLHNINQRTNDRQATQGSRLVAPGIYDIDNTTNVTAFGGGFSRRRLFGIGGDVTVGYKDYAYITITARNDWSSTLPKNGNSFFYPGVTGSFVFTNLVKVNPSILSFGKLRASWAKSGNDASPYSLQTVYNVNTTGGNNTSGFAFPFIGTSNLSLGNTLGDPNLTPEFTREIELGAELRFLKDKIGVDFAFYKKNTTNQIGSVSLPPASGYSAFLTNFGEIQNKGIEITVDATPVNLNNEFKWSLLAAFTRNRNLVISLTDGVNEIPQGPRFGSPYSTLRPGLPFGVIVGSTYARTSDGQVLINQLDGRPIVTPGNLQPVLPVIGDPNPDFTLGLTNTFVYKSLTMSVLVDWRQGGDIYSLTAANLLARGVTTDTEDREWAMVINGVFGNPATAQPLTDAQGKFIPNNVIINANTYWFRTGGAQEAAIWDATTIRLREVTLGYQIPQKWLNKTPFGKISIEATARNLWFTTPNLPKGVNVDPEVSTFGAGNIQGMDFQSPPNVRRWGVNLRATF